MPINVAYIGQPTWVGGPTGPMIVPYPNPGQRIVSDPSERRTISVNIIETALGRLQNHVSTPLLNCYRNAFELASAPKPEEAHKVIGDIVPQYRVQDGIPIFTIKYAVIFRSQVLPAFRDVMVCFDVAVCFLEQVVQGMNTNVPIMQTLLSEEPRLARVENYEGVETSIHAAITTGLDKTYMEDT